MDLILAILSLIFFFMFIVENFWDKHITFMENFNNIFTLIKQRS